MSEDKLATALSRIAQLETEVQGYRARKPEHTLDPAVIRAALTADPIGALKQMGVPVDHVTRVIVANAMGDSAPPELRVLAAMGPQVTAQHALDAKVEALSRQLTSLTSAAQSNGVRESFKAVAKDKSKYPHLAKAFAADPALFDEELAKHGGNAEEFATRQEARLLQVGAAMGLPPTASEETAADTADHSSQVKPALASTMGGAPPLPKEKQGVFTQEDHASLRDEIVRKHTPQNRA